MINFTVGPVQSSDRVCAVGSEQVPYFRTAEFSQLIFENEKLIKKFANAENDARAVFITGSGTASMEATVINMLTGNDRALVVDGGSFGHRFVELCEIHGIPHDVIKIESGKKLTSQRLSMYVGRNYTAFLINVHETSTGVLYDMGIISKFCKDNKLFLIVDAISSFLADRFNMAELGVDVMITGSQKALACPPGISIIVLSKKAINRVQNNDSKCMYLNLKNALKDGERGQTPFTPAVGILRQINTRLKEIDAAGGVENETNKISLLAEDFRNRIRELPFKVFSESMSNALTPLQPLNTSAYDIFLTLKDQYNIWVCPSGGDLKDRLIRVGHIGALTFEDNKKLISALRDMKERGLI